MLGRWVPLANHVPRQGDPFPRRESLDVFMRLSQEGEPGTLCITSRPEPARPASADWSQQLLDQAAESRSDPLGAWKALVAEESRAKKAVGGLARYFVFQHYWRLLDQQYAEAIKGRQSAVLDLFAEFSGEYPPTQHGWLGDVSGCTLLRHELQRYSKLLY